MCTDLNINPYISIMTNKLYLCKIASWSVLAFSASGLIAYAWTKQLITSGGIAATEFGVKLTMYACFEHIWGKYLHTTPPPSAPSSSASAPSIDP